MICRYLLNLARVFVRKKPDISFLIDLSGRDRATAQMIFLTGTEHCNFYFFNQLPELAYIILIAIFHGGYCFVSTTVCRQLSFKYSSTRSADIAVSPEVKTPWNALIWAIEIHPH